MQIRTIILLVIGLILAFVSRWDDLRNSISLIRQNGWILDIAALLGIVCILAAILDAFPEIRSAIAERIKPKPPLPQPVKVILPNYEERIQKLESKEPLPRLTAEQKSRLASFFKERKGWHVRVQWVNSYSRHLAQDFAEIFEAAGWRIFCTDYNGPRRGFTNVVICVTHKSDLAFAEEVMQKLIREEIAATAAICSDAGPNCLTVLLGEEIDIHYHPD